MPDLRYLALNAAQWMTLADQGTSAPHLAAARSVVADATLDMALAWTARLGLDTSSALRVGGTLTDNSAT
ncbi:hypothetical protein KDL01_10920 [Actinospica durhamensis]|uniref:Uncharacterized protein n=1 Tax=Actinospica durhamensis TaxID=1508375 RepID=A0A941EJS0_9ACTN|nr:hypothetical protein [Actinospica durhamensis]MBR7833780.1 hypothetical protein [Actinospica durhamensis]